MEITVLCPGCQASLALPSLAAGHTVQCPRCQQVFEPMRKPAVSAPVAGRPPRETPIDVDDEPIFRRVANPRALRGERMATAVCVLLVVASIACLMQAFIQYQRARTLQEEIQRGRFNQADLDWIEDFMGLVHGMQSLLILPVLICFLAWLYKASSNAHGLRASALHFTPGWAVGSFFIPIMNLFGPYLILQELWRSSDPEATDDGFAWKSSPRSFVAVSWWLFCIAGAILASAADSADNRFVFFRRNPEDELHAAILHGLGNLCLAIAGLLQVYLVFKITQRQRDRFIRLYEAPG